jgi:hypothetical protein
MTTRIAENSPITFAGIAGLRGQEINSKGITLLISIHKGG